MLDLFRMYKIEYKDYIVLIKSGSFYISFDEDAVILNKIFGYKIVPLKNNIKVGFPISLRDKNIDMLERKKINYVIIEDKKLATSLKFKFNNYKKYKENYLDFISIDMRINKINNKLKELASTDNVTSILDKIEMIMNG